MSAGAAAQAQMPSAGLIKEMLTLSLLDAAPGGVTQGRKAMRVGVQIQRAGDSHKPEGNAPKRSNAEPPYPSF